MLPALEHLRLVDVCCQQPLRSPSLRKLTLAFTDSSIIKQWHVVPVEQSSGLGASQQGGGIGEQYDLPRPDVGGCPNLRSLQAFGGVLPGVIVDAWGPALSHVTSLEVGDNPGDFESMLWQRRRATRRAHQDLDIHESGIPDSVGRVGVIRAE